MAAAFTLVSFTVSSILVTSHTEVTNTKVYSIEDNALAQAVGGSNVRDFASDLMQCVLRCTKDPECSAANYDHDTSQCLLTTPYILRLVAENGTTAFVVEDKTIFHPAQSQIGMWPLNKKYQVRNLMDGKSDLELYGVTYTDVSNLWFSPPVRFSGASNSYGRLMNVGDVSSIRSFGWIAAMYREQTADFPLFEWDNGVNYITHIWIYVNVFVINMYRNGCTNGWLSSTVPISNNRWYILAVSYDADLSLLSIWVDGELEQKQISACAGHLTAPTNVWVNRRTVHSDIRRMAGHITCMSYYTEALTYDEMYNSTFPLCRN